MRKLYTLILIAAFFFSPFSVSAQTTNQSLQRFRPGVDIRTTGKNIGGISFSGVGSSVLGCLDVGGRVVNGISSLFNNKSSGLTAPNKFNFSIPKGDQSVPVVSKTNDKKLDEIKKKESCLDAIAYTLAKQALAQVTNKTLTWINTGMDGNPFYVKNMGSLLGSIEKQSFMNYIRVVNQSDNQIIGQSVTNKLIELITGKQVSQSELIPVTEAEKKYDAFSKNFTSGGWGSWLNTTVGNENPLGRFLGVTEKISQDYGTKEEELVNEANQGNGFLSAKTCIRYAPAPNEDDDISFSLNPDGSQRCLEWQTTTPGSVIASQAQTITNSTTRQLEAADELNEVLGAFFDNMLNKLIQRGLNGLHKETTKNIGASYNASLITSGNIGGIDIGYQSSENGFNTQDFDISRPQQLRAVMQVQYDFLNKARDSQIALERILPTLGSLDYCIPGPNPTWANGLNENYQSFISSLDTPTKGRSTLNNILSTIPLIGGLFGTEDKEIQYALAGTPSLYDKVTDSSIDISPWSYLYYTKDYSRGVKNTDGDWIRGWINGGYNSITKKYQENFTTEKITALFTAVDPNTSYATGAIKESLKETSNILGYRSAIAELDPQYDQIISEKIDQIAELEEIRQEANQIVRTAKARYITSQANAGTPVNLSCINRAYVIDESPIVGTPRQESDSPNPMIDTYLESNDYFYRNL